MPAIAASRNQVSDTQFHGFTLPEMIRHFEVEGFVIIPGVLESDLVGRIRNELKDLPMRGSFYSPEPVFGAKPPNWHSRSCAELIGHPQTVQFLRALMGEDIVFTHGHYMTSPRSASEASDGDEKPTLALHADYKPYGSTYSRWEETCPVRVRILYYLGDSDGLRILPRSHISFHADAHPYRRYAKHPDAVSVEMHRGSALIFSVRLFHGSGTNTMPQPPGSEPMAMLEYDYRPLWARPIMPVDEWPPEAVEAAPPVARPFLRSPNSLDKNWEFLGFETEDVPAPGISPHRWGD